MVGGWGVGVCRGGTPTFLPVSPGNLRAKTLGLVHTGIIFSGELTQLGSGPKLPQSVSVQRGGGAIRCAFYQK
ncbi:hypothetical protein NQZ68_004187 [Dissostichus eleginoides]|nr:hypothetical protein NQZ68_004187 [Dissostichus eleginoides]